MDTNAPRSITEPRFAASAMSAGLGMARVQELKTWPEFFEEVVAERKPFELRKDDGRHFEVGDVLYLREWSPLTETYTGRWAAKRVPYLMRGPGFGLAPGWVCMALGYSGWTPNVKGNGRAGDAPTDGD